MESISLLSDSFHPLLLLLLSLVALTKEPNLSPESMEIETDGLVGGAAVAAVAAVAGEGEGEGLVATPCSSSAR